jgi:predicted O-methyltransferase YrrM
MNAEPSPARSEIHRDLGEHYLSAGLSPEQFWFGPEHPALEERALRLLRERPSQRVLEIGYSAGGFAVPLISALHASPTFAYCGLDSLVYPNAVARAHVETFLAARGVPAERYRFVIADAWDGLMRSHDVYDLVLIDHVKGLYPRELTTLYARDLVAPGGIVLLHDVCEKAAEAWKTCSALCDAFGWTWTVDETVPAGLAIVRADPGRGSWTATAHVAGMRARYGVRLLARALRAR